MAKKQRAQLPVPIGDLLPPPEFVEQVRQMILSGAPEYTICQAIAKKMPNQAERPLIAAAMQELRESGQWDSTIVAGWCFEATRALYQKMVAAGDYADALRAVKQLSEFAGKRT